MRQRDTSTGHARNDATPPESTAATAWSPIGAGVTPAVFSFATSYSPSRIVVYVSWRSSAAELSLIHI